MCRDISIGKIMSVRRLARYTNNWKTNGPYCKLTSHARLHTIRPIFVKSLFYSCTYAHLGSGVRHFPDGGSRFQSGKSLTHTRTYSFTNTALFITDSHSDMAQYNKAYYST